MKATRFLLLILSLGAVSAAYAADAIEVKETKDFNRLAKESDQKRLPILLMFSAEYCGYCERVEEEFLKPMLRSGDYEDKVLIRKIKIDGFDDIRDFDGKQISIDAFTSRYNVVVTPTVAFLDGNGAQLAPKRVGLSTPDFYGGYLDQSIDAALDMLRRNKPLRVKLSSLGVH